MSNEKPSQEAPKFDQHEMDLRYKESREAEDGILAHLQELMQEVIRQGQSKEKKGRPENSLRSLESVLRSGFNRWQFFGDGRLGLDSGMWAEAFSRLVGVGIMEEMPELCDLPYNTTDYGAKIVSQPPFSRNKKIIIEVLTDVGEGENMRGCRFRFNASLKEVNKRIKDIGKENEEKSKEIRSWPE